MLKLKIFSYIVGAVEKNEWLSYLKMNIVYCSLFSTAAAIKYLPFEENFKSIIFECLSGSVDFGAKFFGNSSQSYLKYMLPFSLPKAKRVLPSY